MPLGCLIPTFAPQIAVLGSTGDRADSLARFLEQCAQRVDLRWRGWTIKVQRETS